MPLKTTHAAVRVWRIWRIFFHLAWGMTLAVIWLPRHSGHHRHRHLVSQWSAQTIRILNVRLRVSGAAPQHINAAMLVANHVSWLDVFLINAIHPVRFVAKSEVRDWPIVGWLTKKTGVIFIQRGRRRDTARVSELGSQALLNGESLCVFPEGTTTDGEYMLPFRSSLLQAAVDAEAEVWPVAIRYALPDGSANKAVAYAGETTLWESIYAMAAQQTITAELIFLPPIPPQQDRRVIAQVAEDAVRARLNLPLPVALETVGDLQDATR